MIVMVETDEPAFAPHRFSHIECDVEGCGQRAPSFAQMREKGKSLFEMGWFIEPNMHRCPSHFHDEAPARGPQYRSAEENKVEA